jgi:uncharacterized protein YqeY
MAKSKEFHFQEKVQAYELEDFEKLFESAKSEIKIYMQYMNDNEMNNKLIENISTFIKNEISIDNKFLKLDAFTSSFSL